MGGAPGKEEQFLTGHRTLLGHQVPSVCKPMGGCGNAGPWTRWLSLAVPDASRAGRFAHTPRDNT